MKEAAEVGEEGLGQLLRREGLHEATLAEFRQEVLEAAAKGFEAARRPRSGMPPEEARIHRLEAELARKEKALAEAAALLVLRKKAEALFPGEEEGGNTNGNSE